VLSIGRLKAASRALLNCEQAKEIVSLLEQDESVPKIAKEGIISRAKDVSDPSCWHNNG
jgi:hypothetical protein